MECQSIDGLKLDNESLRAIEEIRRKRNLAEYLTSTLSSGVLATILTTGKPLLMSYNIYQSDFQAFANAMFAVPVILRGEIEKIAGRQLIRSLDPKQRSFWKGIYYGCN